MTQIIFITLNCWTPTYLWCLHVSTNALMPLLSTHCPPWPVNVVTYTQRVDCGKSEGVRGFEVVTGITTQDEVLRRMGVTASSSLSLGSFARREPAAVL